MTAYKSKTSVEGGLSGARSAVAIAVAVAIAGTSPSLRAEAAGESYALDEIVVTARKREERLQDVPISATTLTGENLQSAGKTQLTDLATSVPNLSYSDVTEGGSFVMRGITTRAVSAGLEDGLGVYVDGVLAGRQAAYNQELTRIDRVETLRGPQGTLFGKNTMSGAINIVTRKPTDTFEADATVSYGNLDSAGVSGSISGPLTEKVFGAISGSYSDRDGYLTNTVNGEELQDLNRRGARLQLRALPTEKWELNFSADMLKEKRHAVGGQLASGRGAVDPFGFTEGIFQPTFERSGPRTIELDGPSRDDVELCGFGLTSDYDFGSGYRFTSVTGYRVTEEDIAKDSDASALDVTNTIRSNDAKQFSQELRIASPADRRFDYVAGLYYYYQKVDVDSLITLGADFGLPPQFDRIVNAGDVTTRSYAIFANGNYRLTDRLTLGLGVRYTNEEKEVDWMQEGVVLFGLPSFTTTDKIEEDDVSPTASLTFALNDDISIYGRIARGYKSGGFNMDVVSTPEIAFGSENATAYEIGWKSELLERRVRLNVALFHTDFKDIQTFQLTDVTGETRNAGEATLKGGEIELAARVFRGLTIDAGLAYTDARYDRFPNCGPGGEDCADKRLYAAPDWTASTAIQYSHPFAGGRIVTRGEWEHRGDAYFDARNVPASRAESFNLLNARLGYVSGSGMWEAFLWGRNLTDETYEVFREQFAILQQDRVVYGPPRTYGIELRVNF